MDISFDKRKNKELVARRGISFEQVKVLFCRPHHIEPRGSDYPGQEIAIGYVGRKLWTVVFEDIEDDIGPLRWLVTYWPSEPHEKRKYHGT